MQLRHRWSIAALDCNDIDTQLYTMHAHHVIIPQSRTLSSVLELVQFGVVSCDSDHFWEDRNVPSSPYSLCQWLAASENIVGYYSTGPRLKESDADLNELMAGYADWPLLLICEVQVSMPACCLNHCTDKSSHCLSGSLPSFSILGTH